MTSGKRSAEPAQAAPYLSHSTTLNARHPPHSTPDNSTPRSHKSKSKKKREDRYEEEIQYNLSYNFRGSRRQAQSSRMRDEADFPPPPTYESATAVSTLVSENYVHQGGPPHPCLASPALTVASLPLPDARSLHVGSDRSDTFSIDTASLSLLQPPREEDRSSVELVDLEPSERWELDRMRGIPLDERVQRHRLRTETTVSQGGSPVPFRARLASQPTASRNPGSQARFLASQLSLRIPESRDRYENDRNQGDNNSDLSSTPPTPKHHRMPSIPGSPSRFFHGARSHSPQPSSSVISLLRNPSPFFKSTPSLLNVSPSNHGTPHRTRLRFHRKTKERALSEPLEDWEVLDDPPSGESSVNGPLPPPTPPATPQKRSMRHLPKSTPPDVFVGQSTKFPVNRSRKVNTVQIPQMVSSEVHRPASPPFVNRHVRRHTTSSRGGQMGASSAPVSPISVASTATFNTSTTSLSQNTLADEEISAGISTLAERGVASEPPRRNYEPLPPSRTPRVSSPPPTVLAYEQDPDLPIMSGPTLGSLPTRSATERIVRSPDARDENHALVRGRSLSRDMGMRSAPAYSSIFPSGPPPLPNMTQNIPPASIQPSPRRHYPGRPLPATPPISPSLTWILDKGTAHVPSNPKLIVSAAPSTPPIPEGLLIDLDDDSLDTVSTPSSNPTTPLCMDILGLEEDDGEDDNDNASDSGTVSPPGPLTPTTSAYASASASSLTLSTAASRSVEYFDTSMQMTPTNSEVPDINGLVSSLGDHEGMSDGSNYDALLLIADLLGPATPPPPPPPASVLQLPSVDNDADCILDEEEGEEESNCADELGLDPNPVSGCHVGKVELVRKRVTRDGRVKLKMSLLGVAVEKCAICMTQFKDGDGAISGATCKHAFHEKCLENWLDRSQTCPLCRERLGAR